MKLSTTPARKNFRPTPGQPWTCKDCGTQDAAKRRKAYRYRCKDCWRSMKRLDPDWREKQAENDRKPASRFNNLKQMAKRRRMPVLLTLAQYTDLISKPCIYCEGPLALTGGGLDRKDNDKPYDLENSVPSCAFCNELKGRSLLHEEGLILGPGVKQIRLRRERLGLPPLESHLQVLTKIHLGQMQVNYSPAKKRKCKACGIDWRGRTGECPVCYAKETA
jgi:hypothetical protein